MLQEPVRELLQWLFSWPHTNKLSVMVAHICAQETFSGQAEGQSGTNLTWTSFGALIVQRASQKRLSLCTVTLTNAKMLWIVWRRRRAEILSHGGNLQRKNSTSNKTFIVCNHKNNFSIAWDIKNIEHQCCGMLCTSFFWSVLAPDPMQPAAPFFWSHNRVQKVATSTYPFHRICSLSVNILSELPVKFFHKTWAASCTISKELQPYATWTGTSKQKLVFIMMLK